MKLKFVTMLFAALAAQSVLAGTTRPLTCPLISEVKEVASQMTAAPCEFGEWCGSISDLSFGKHKWSLHVTRVNAVDEADAKVKSINVVNGLLEVLGPGQDNTRVWYCEYLSQDDGAVFLVTPPQKM